MDRHQQGELFKRELLIGPAGCGKTHQILARFLAELEAGREDQVLLLVPTASFREHTRHTVLRSGRVPALLGRSVATFDDLAGENGAPELSSPRRELMVRRLLRDLDLPYLRPVVDFAGFREALVEEAEGAIAAGLAAEELERRLPPRAGDRLRAQVLNRRDAFLKFLRLYQAATAPFRSPAQTDARPQLLLVDGFADFTTPQQRLLETLVGRAASAVATLPHDSDAARRFLEGLGFRATCLEGNQRASPDCRSLADLERSLRGQKTGLAPLAADSAIAVFTGADRRDEVDLVAREILRLARDHGYSYREIGVVVQNADAYLPLIQDLFRRHGIPARLFFPTTVSETAMGRHLLACLDLFRAEDVSRPAAVLAVLKSPYSPVLKRAVVERFEYAMMENRAQAERGDWESCLKHTRLPALQDFFAGMAGFQKLVHNSSSVRTLAGRISEVWKAFTLLREVPPHTSHARGLELRADAAALVRAGELVEEIAAAAEAEQEKPDFAAFAALLAEEMGRARFRVPDRRQDAVAVMNAYEARQWELRAVFVVGLVEKEFPRPPRQSLFLEEEERKSLKLVTAEERGAEERRLFYVAATRARERLVLSHPATDGRGAALLQSFFLTDQEALLPASARRWRRGPADLVCPRELVVREADLFDLAHREFGSPWAAEERLALARALYNLAPRREFTARAAAALAERPPCLTLPAALERIRQQETSFNASRFQTFAHCPFQHFARYVLHLEGAPEEAEGLNFLLRGEIIHETLREWERGSRSEPILAVFDGVFTAHTRGIPITHAEQKLRSQMRDDLEKLAIREAEHGASYRTQVTPELVEKAFGDGEVPPVRLTLEDGTTIEMTGRLDRVETAAAGEKRLGLVVDFKYSARGFDAKRLQEIEAGRELQIPLYLLAAREALGLEPAGAELYALREEPRRAGVFNSALAGTVFAGQPPPGAVLLPPATFRNFMERGKHWMAEYAVRIRKGEIAVHPHDTEQCKKGGCEFYDLCRVDKWTIRKA